METLQFILLREGFKKIFLTNLEFSRSLAFSCIVKLMSYISHTYNIYITLLPLEAGTSKSSALNSKVDFLLEEEFFLKSR